MITPQERAQVLYEISMGIGTSLNLKRMLKTAMSTMVRKLNCVGAVVYQAESYGNRVSYLSALSIPRNITESESLLSSIKI